MMAWVVCLTAAGIVEGRTITVDDDGPADFNTIQAAIDDSNDGDIVEIQPGIYTGDGNRDIDFFGKAITVRSTDPNDPEVVAATIVDANGSEGEPHRGFHFHSGERASSALEGLTITNGYAAGSQEEKLGGAIYFYYSSPKISNCVFVGNTALNSGGALKIEQSNLVLTNCTFKNNSCINKGGGINSNSDYLTLTGCTFVANSAGPPYGRGGAVRSYGCTASLTNCIFVGNSAGYEGGAVNNYNGVMSVNNCTFLGNSSGKGGGAICNYKGGSLTLTSSILWNNTAPAGPEVFVDSSKTVYQSEAFISFSDIRGGEPNVYVDPCSILNWGQGNIDADPCFADPCNSDYHLKSREGRWDPNSESWVVDDVTSPCIDKGDPNTPVGAERNPNGGRINLGAYGGTAWASKSVTCWDASACAGQPYGDANCDGAINLADLYVLKAAFGSRAPWTDPQCCADFGRDAFVDLGDLITLKINFGTSGYSPSIGSQLCPP
jgi:predicted outer membrane repeat protein